jgi:predicted dehydrogenase
MSDRVLKVGVIGLGQIAQIMHLRYLKELPTFEIAAVCDVSQALVQQVGDHYGVAKRYTNHRDLLEQRDLDVVLNVTRFHAPVTIDALNAGKHVMTEKPIGFNLEEADAIIAAAQRNKVKLMVAYMKRYDPSYQWAMERFKRMEDLRLIRIHDYGGAFQINNEIYDLYKGGDIPERFIKAEEEQVQASLTKAIGADRADLTGTYSGLLHLCTHDAIILRQAFGTPEKVLYVDLVERSFVNAILQYPNNVRCVWESGMARNPTPWDEHLAAYGSDSIVRVDFPFPYLHNGETVVTVKEREGESFVEKRVTASFDEAFKREWRHFYECITQDKEPITNGAEGRADVALLADMVKAIRR